MTNGDVSVNCQGPAADLNMKVFLGEHNHNEKFKHLSLQTYHVRKVQIHPNFTNSVTVLSSGYLQTEPRHDVAILTLDREVVTSPHVMPICLPHSDIDIREAITVGKIKNEWKFPSRILILISLLGKIKFIFFDHFATFGTSLKKNVHHRDGLPKEGAGGRGDGVGQEVPGLPHVSHPAGGEGARAAPRCVCGAGGSQYTRT